MTPLDIAAELLLRADQPGEGPKFVLGGEMKWWPAGALDSLMALRLLVPNGLMRETACTECDEPHSEPVHYDDPGRPFIYCSAMGRVELEPAELSRHQISLSGMATKAAEALGTGRTPHELIKGRQWSLGRSTSLDRPDVHLIRGAGWPDASERFASLKRSTDALVLTLSARLPTWLPQGRGYSLETLFSWNQPLITIQLPAPQTQDSDDQCSLIRIGTYWSVTWRGETQAVPDRVGLMYLAPLLSNPGREIPSLELLTLLNKDRSALRPPRILELSPSGEASGAEILDASSRAEYRARISLLDAKKRSSGLDTDEQRELVFVQSELRRLTGHRGKPRRMTGPGEQARTRISQAIIRVESEFDRVLPSFAEHLRRSIISGSVFTYAPSEALHWKISTTL